MGFASLDIEDDLADKIARTANGIVCDFLKAADRQKKKDMLPKRTFQGKNRLKIDLGHPKHLKLEKSLKQSLITHMNTWLKKDENSPYNYVVTDACFRLAGTGSLGVNRYELLLESTNDVGDRFMLLDMKEAMPATIATHRVLQPVWKTEAERVVSIQRRMQNRAPALLSSTIFNDRSYIVQEMQPEKDSINFKMLRDRYRDMYQVIDNMGMLTASSQLRSAGRQGSAIADDLIAFGEK